MHFLIKLPPVTLSKNLEAFCEYLKTNKPVHLAVSSILNKHLRPKKSFESLRMILLP